MPKYKKVNENIIDKFIDKVFGSIAKGIHSAALKDLGRKDSQFKKDYETMQKIHKRVRARYKTDQDYEDAVQKTVQKYT